MCVPVDDNNECTDDLCDADNMPVHVAKAAGATLDNAAKVNVYLTDLGNFAKVNEAMTRYFNQPFPARAAVGVAAVGAM